MNSPPLFRTVRLPLLAALGVALPTLWMGLFGDDVIHLALIEGAPSPFRLPGSPFDLFRFASGNAAETQAVMQHGPLPWWTLPELKLAFWRPLSSATAVLDHALFGRATVPAHLHSVLWYLGLVVLCGVLFRRLLPGVAALALLVFALDDTHFGAVGWLANRNALVAALPALFGLWMHLEWRERHKPWAAPLSALGFALGLLGGESALGVLAYVLAYEALGARGPLTERLRGLAPAVLVGLLYLVTYKVLGHGAWGSDNYLDPVSQPGDWLRAVPSRVLSLLAGLLLGAPAELANIPDLVAPLMGLGLAGVALLSLMLRAVWPRLGEDERLHVRWLLAGTVLALLPVTSTLPSNRLLLVPSLGASAAVGVVLSHWWRTKETSWRLRRVAVATGAGVLVLSHVVLAPVSWPLMTWYLRDANVQGERVVEDLRRQLDMSRVSSQRLVVLGMPQPVHAMYAPFLWWKQGGPAPRAWWTLSMADEVPALTRTGPASFELSLSEARFLAGSLERNFRGAAFPLAPGATVQLDGMRVSLLEADEQGPRRLGFTFDVPLEDPSLVLLHWKDNALRPLAPPPEGTRLELAKLAEGT